MTPGYLLLQSDARLIPLADRSVHCVVTSPPYWGLRDYGTASWAGGDDPGCDHRKNEKPRSTRPAGLIHGMSDENHAQYHVYTSQCCKCGARRIDRQIGLEDTIEAWVEVMVRVFGEVYRVLRDDGTLYLNIGYSYDGHGNLIDQPGMLKDALVKSGWYCKAPIVWHKPNPMPGSQTMRPTISHEMVYMMAKDAGTDYYWDAEAVREPLSWPAEPWGIRTPRPGIDVNGGGQASAEGIRSNPAGRSLRSVWTIATESFPGAHFATFPRKLVEPCIKAGTSEKGYCPRCGAGWVRETDISYTPGGTGGAPRKRSTDEPNDWKGWPRMTRQASTLGWHPSCSCGEWTCPKCCLMIVNSNKKSCPRCQETMIFSPLKSKPAIVLDPFIGSGTTIVVANALGRHAIGLDLSQEYLTNQAKRRIERPHARPIKPAHVEPAMPLFGDIVP